MQKVSLFTIILLTLFLLSGFAIAVFQLGLVGIIVMLIFGGLFMISFLAWWANRQQQAIENIEAGRDPIQNRPLFTRILSLLCGCIGIFAYFIGEDFQPYIRIGAGIIGVLFILFFIFSLAFKDKFNKIYASKTIPIEKRQQYKYIYIIALVILFLASFIYKIFFKD